MSCCVVGDVNIDHITDLSGIIISGTASSCFQNPIRSNVGGNAVFFGEAAYEAGFSDVTVLCSIGNDVAGMLAVEHLQKLGISILKVASNKPTGQVMILYQPNDQRIMVADRGANQDLQVPESEALTELAHKVDLLYISGYMLLNPDQRAAIHSIADALRMAGAKVVLDVVPHDVWRTWTWREYAKMSSCADCIAAEFSTVSAFQKGVPDAMDPQDAVRMLLQHFEFCLLRINDVSDIIIADRIRQRFVTIPYRRTVASLRFTDRILACAMHQYVANPALVFQSDQWLDRAVEIVSRSA
jgi:sugar/nucleoside kinase (ribokinase family)